jgi:alcohol dehydrogenase
MHIAPFSIARLPKIEFGSGALARLPDLAQQYGKRILLITGSGSIETANQWQQLQAWLEMDAITSFQVRITQEPSPAIVDETVNAYRDQAIDLVIGLGGGSVLDAAKAIAGLLHINHSVMDFLEGVGPELAYPGPAVPFIAIPTTAGTGSEATKNAVLSVQGKDGFKKSFRDEQLVAEYALVDPDLLTTCPADLIAANGMDALTQLMESFVSLKANLFTDALAISGLRACRDGLPAWYHKTGDQQQARESMAYASLVSGINLAQTGLGSVHGLASPLGAFLPIPHGVVCGTLVSTATRINIEAMQQREPDNPALQKYARLATILCNHKFRDRDDAYAALIKLLDDWTESMQLQRLGSYGVQQDDFGHIVNHSRGSSMKTNPIVLSDAEIIGILAERV